MRLILLFACLFILAGMGFSYYFLIKEKVKLITRIIQHKNSQI